MKKLVLITLLGLCSLTFAQNEMDLDILSEQVYNITIPEKQIECLARNMYFEAKNEPEEGIKAVGYVTINRVNDKSFPKSICGVVYQRTGKTCQFSWVCQLGKNPKIVDQDKYARIKQLATEVVYSMMTPSADPTRGSLFFHAVHVSPQWKLRKTVKIGQHIFYSRKRHK